MEENYEDLIMAGAASGGCYTLSYLCRKFNAS